MRRGYDEIPFRVTVYCLPWYEGSAGPRAVELAELGRRGDAVVERRAYAEDRFDDRRCTSAPLLEQVQSLMYGQSGGRLARAAGFGGDDALGEVRLAERALVGGLRQTLEPVEGEIDLGRCGTDPVTASGGQAG